LANTIVVKIGGATFGNHDPIIEDLVALQKKGIQVVAVHGGGNVVSKWLAKQDIATSFVNGERVTDQPALEMVTAVLGGLVNKEIVATINCMGGRAVGISGVDGALIQSKQRKAALGYVGEVVKVNTTLLEALLQADFIPIISPISLYAIDRPADAPGILNINGDPLAGEIAAAIKAEKLIFLTDVAGILDKQGTTIPRLVPEEARQLLDSGVASGGMIPKINACLRAASVKSKAYIIDGREPGALLKAVEGKYTGTIIGG